MIRNPVPTAWQMRMNSFRSANSVIVSRRSCDEFDVWLLGDPTLLAPVNKLHPILEKFSWNIKDFLYLVRHDVIVVKESGVKEASSMYGMG